MNHSSFVFIHEHLGLETATQSWDRKDYYFKGEFGPAEPTGALKKEMELLRFALKGSMHVKHETEGFCKFCTTKTKRRTASDKLFRVVM
jgi:hypothetical protein